MGAAAGREETEELYGGQQPVISRNSSSAGGLSDLGHAGGRASYGGHYSQVRRPLCPQALRRDGSPKPNDLGGNPWHIRSRLRTRKRIAFTGGSAARAVFT